MKVLKKSKTVPLVLKRNKTVYYKYGTTPNVIVVGSPTISNGVMSGFSSANYGIALNSFDVGSNPWEMVFKVKTGTNITTLGSMVGHTGSVIYDPVYVGVKSSKFVITLCSSSSGGAMASDEAGTYTVLANTNYWVKLTFDGTKYVLSYSLNGKDFIQDIVVESTKTIWTSNLAIGRQNGSSSEYPWLGSIDLQGCYINVSGKRLWTGTLPEEVSGESYDYTENKTVYLGVR